MVPCRNLTKSYRQHLGDRIWIASDDIACDGELGSRFSMSTGHIRSAAGELLKQGKRIGLQEQPFRLSVILLEHSGEVVTRAEIRSRIWEENTFVDFDSSLRVAVGKLRSLLTGSLEILTLSSKLRLDVTMPWNRGGQVQVKSCAAPSGTDRPQAPTMRLND